MIISFNLALNRQNLSSASDNTNVDHLRPKTSAASSLKTINKSSATTKHVSIYLDLNCAAQYKVI